MSFIKGINHVVLVTNDMKKTLYFYEEILQLKLKATVGVANRPEGTLAKDTDEWKRFYFFDLGNGDTLAYIEFPKAEATAEPSIFTKLWPEEPKRPVGELRKVDHLALNVETTADLLALQQRLRDYGVNVSERQDLKSAPFIRSIYCYDPNGFPLEFATWDDANTRSLKEMQGDPEPVGKMLFSTR